MIQYKKRQEVATTLIKSKIKEKSLKKLELKQETVQNLTDNSNPNVIITEPHTACFCPLTSSGC